MWNIAALAQPIFKILVSEQKYKNNLKNRESFATAQVKQEYFFFLASWSSLNAGKLKTTVEYL